MRTRTEAQATVGADPSELTARRAIAQCGAVMVWVLLVTTLALVLDREWRPGPWPAVALQAFAYIVMAVPIVVFARPRIRLGCIPAWIAVSSAAVLVLGLLWALFVAHETGVALAQRAIDAVTAGGVEEFLFRGVLWEGVDRVIQSRKRVTAMVVIEMVTTLLFAVFHAPRLLLLGGHVADLVPVLAIGLGLGVLRAASRGLALPTAFHIALDLAGQS